MKKERFEWVHSWCDYTDKTDLPRILLIGDSITYHYYPIVKEMLKGKFYVDYIANSYSIDMPVYGKIIEGFASDSKYDLIHYNNGLHGFDVSEKRYKKCLEKLVGKLSANAKLVLATSTFIYKKGNEVVPLKEAEIIEKRNLAVYSVAGKNGLAVDDLYAVSCKIDKELRRPDGVHYRKGGSRILAEAVCKSIIENINK